MASVMKKAAPRRKDKKKPKLTDAERHERFVALAKEVEASENPKDFDDALTRVLGAQRRKK